MLGRKIAGITAFLAALPLGASTADYARFVDVFTGTAGTGHTHPSASYPFGMIQAGPDTGIGDWAYCSGYQFRDHVVYGYSQNHLSGTGCTDYGDVQVLPFVAGGDPKETTLPMTRVIDKSSERAEPETAPEAGDSAQSGEDDAPVEVADDLPADTAPAEG